MVARCGRSEVAAADWTDPEPRGCRLLILFHRLSGQAGPPSSEAGRRQVWRVTIRCCVVYHQCAVILH